MTLATDYTGLQDRVDKGKSIGYTLAFACLLTRTDGGKAQSVLDPDAAL